MRLATYRAGIEPAVGLGLDDGMLDLTARLGLRTMRDALGRLSDIRALRTPAADHPYAAIRFLPVVPDAAHIYCVGANYADHAKEVAAAGIVRPPAQHPMIFIRFNETFVGHGEDLVVPHVSRDFDFEAELAIVIGKGGRYIPEERALEHVAGYTCCNEGSIRDWQFHTSQVVPGKNFLATGGIGPFLVTPDEIPDVGQLEISLLLNGEVMQHSNTRHLIFGLPQIIAYVSAFVPLLPGDVIATGTPAGVGFSRKPPVFMKPGDVCEVVIEHIGTLRNSIVAEKVTI